VALSGKPRLGGFFFHIIYESGVAAGRIVITSFQMTVLAER